MENKAAIAVILSVISVIGGIVLNFGEFAWGSPANAKNLFVTFAYIAIWVFIIFISIKHKSRRVIKYCLTFWILTFFFSLLTTYINVTEGLANWAIPFVIILLGPLYGIRFLVNDFLIFSIVIAVISFVISIATILLFRQVNKQMVG